MLFLIRILTLIFGLLTICAPPGQANSEPFIPLPPKPWLTIGATDPYVGGLQKKFARLLGLESLQLEDLHLAPNFVGRWGEWRAIPAEPASPFKFSALEPKAIDLTPEPFMERLRAHWVGYKKVQLQTKLHQIYLSSDPKAGGLTGVGVFIWWLKGVNPTTGERIQETGDLRAAFRGDGKGHWELERVELLAIDRLAYTGPTFVDGFLSRQWHLDPGKQRQLQESLNHRQPTANGGLNIIDLNEDGLLDVYFAPNFSRPFLFIQDGNGGFRDQTVEWGLDVTWRFGNGATSLFWDLDNDGDLDLVNAQVVGGEGENPSILAMENRGKRFYPRTEALGFAEKYLPPERKLKIFIHSTIVPVDINQDGLMDIYVGGYSTPNYNAINNLSNLNARNGFQNLLFINHGKWKFTEESEARGLKSERMTLCALFHDFDGDGDLDLLEGNDFAPDDYWENDGKGHFNRGSRFDELSSIRATMGFTLGDFNQDGFFDLYVSGMYSKAGNRFLHLAWEQFNPAIVDRVMVFARGNGLYEAIATGSYRDTAIEKGINRAGWAWGSAALDVENDGDTDIFVVNGFSSHERKELPDF